VLATQPDPLPPTFQNPQFAAWVVRVDAVDDAGATHGRPPRLTVTVDEVLRGAGTTGAQAAQWAQSPSGRDLDCGLPTRDDCWRAWAARPLAGPAAGTRWIVTGNLDPSGSYAIQAWSAVPYSEATRAHVVAGMAREPSTALGAATLLVPLAALVLYLWARSGSPAGTRGLLWAVAAAPVLALLLYAAYERTVSSTYNIRVDLLLVIPALVLSALISLAAIHRLRS
jgi:hypothetical protein